MNIDSQLENSGEKTIAIPNYEFKGTETIEFWSNIPPQTSSTNNLILTLISHLMIKTSKLTIEVYDTEGNIIFSKISQDELMDPNIDHLKWHHYSFSYKAGYSLLVIDNYYELHTFTKNMIPLIPAISISELKITRNGEIGLIKDIKIWNIYKTVEQQRIDTNYIYNIYSSYPSGMIFYTSLITLQPALLVSYKNNLILDTEDLVSTTYGSRIYKIDENTGFELPASKVLILPKGGKIDRVLPYPIQINTQFTLQFTLKFSEIITSTSKVLFLQLGICSFYIQEGSLSVGLKSNTNDEHIYIVEYTQDVDFRLWQRVAFVLDSGNNLQLYINEKNYLESQYVRIYIYSCSYNTN